LVYCAESVDLPDGHEADAVRVDPSVEPKDGRDPEGTDGTDGTVIVAGELAGHAEDSAEPWPYAPLDRPATTPPPAPERAEIVLVPYRSWANRGPSTMRVWLPMAGPDTGAPS
ncbi:glycoside hydrolase family 127 protein, partial [Streptomyces sp. 2MCAF27]